MCREGVSGLCGTYKAVDAHQTLLLPLKPFPPGISVVSDSTCLNHWMMSSVKVGEAWFTFTKVSVPKEGQPEKVMGCISTHQNPILP